MSDVIESLTGKLSRTGGIAGYNSLLAAFKVLADRAESAAETAEKTIVPPDWAVNDPEAGGYIQNRPCYFTGNQVWETFYSGELAVMGECAWLGFPDALLEAGKEYRLTINGVSVTLTAYEESDDDTSYTVLGDSYLDFTATSEGNDTFTTTLGYFLVTGVVKYLGRIIGLGGTDGTGAMLAAAFGLEESALKGNLSVTVEHQVPEAVKLDKRLLPDLSTDYPTIEVYPYLIMIEDKVESLLSGETVEIELTQAQTDELVEKLEKREVMFQYAGMITSPCLIEKYAESDGEITYFTTWKIFGGELTFDLVLETAENKVTVQLAENGNAGSGSGSLVKVVQTSDASSVDFSSYSAGDIILVVSG